MKLPFTEKFLWKLFNGIETLDEIGDFSNIRSIKEAAFPQLYEFRKKWEKEQDRKNFIQLLNYLKRNNLIKVKEVEEKPAVLLTNKGMNKILDIKLKMTDKEKREDGKSIMALFDIPESKRKSRDKFRRSLKRLGYKEFQRSVWLSSYDVLKETRDLVKNHNLQDYIELLLVEEVNSNKQ